MITSRFPLGDVSFTSGYFATLVGEAAKQCYGVAAMIELHIAVSYGLNISTAARSISHRVKDEVEQATGLKVARVVVSVDDVIA